MCIFKSQLIDKGTNKVTKENVIFDTTSSRYDLAIKEVEERVKYSYRDWETDRKSTRLNSSHSAKSRMPSSA